MRHTVTKRRRGNDRKWGGEQVIEALPVYLAHFFLSAFLSSRPRPELGETAKPTTPKRTKKEGIRGFDLRPFFCLQQKTLADTV